MKKTFSVFPADLAKVAATRTAGAFGRQGLNEFPLLVRKQPQPLLHGRSSTGLLPHAQVPDLRTKLFFKHASGGEQGGTVYKVN